MLKVALSAICPHIYNGKVAGKRFSKTLVAGPTPLALFRQGATGAGKVIDVRTFRA